jgi:hypothetical protein
VLADIAFFDPKQLRIIEANKSKSPSHLHQDGMEELKYVIGDSVRYRWRRSQVHITRAVAAAVASYELHAGKLAEIEYR